MPSIYLSASLFTAAERAFNRSLAEALALAGYQVFSPQDIDHTIDQPEVFAQNRDALDHSDLVVAVIDGPDVDSGVAWEIGYAYAKNIPIIGIRTDFRNFSESNTGKVNLMLLYSVEYLEDPCLQWDKVIQAVQTNS